MGSLGHSTTKPETFMLTAEQQENLPLEAKQALEQVDDVCTDSFGANTDSAAQVLPSDCPCKLAGRSNHQALPLANRRVCELCPLVSITSVYATSTMSN